MKTIICEFLHRKYHRDTQQPPPKEEQPIAHGFSPLYTCDKFHLEWFYIFGEVRVKIYIKH